MSSSCTTTCEVDSRPGVHSNGQHQAMLAVLRFRRSSSRNEGERFLQAMIHVYIDDSGDQRKTEYVTCGGILGEAFAVTVMESFWATETKHLAKPFRSTECECQQGQFKTWEKSKCDQLMASLVGILLEPSIRSGVFGVTIPIPLFDRVFPNRDKDDPLRLAVRHVLVNLCKLCRRYSERARVWFESGPNDADMLRAYNDVRDFRFPNTSERDRLAGVSFGNKTLIPLQAADLAARECYKAGANAGIRPIRKPLNRLWGQASFQLFGESCMLKLKEGNGPISIEAIDGMGDECHEHYAKPRRTLSS